MLATPRNTGPIENLPKQDRRYGLRISAIRCWRSLRSDDSGRWHSLQPGFHQVHLVRSEQGHREEDVRSIVPLRQLIRRIQLRELLSGGDARLGAPGSRQRIGGAQHNAVLLLVEVHHDPAVVVRVPTHRELTHRRRDDHRRRADLVHPASTVPILISIKVEDALRHDPSELDAAKPASGYAKDVKMPLMCFDRHLAEVAVARPGRVRVNGPALSRVCLLYTSPSPRDG